MGGISVEILDPVAKLIRAKPGPVQDATRSVLVWGLSGVRAARESGVAAHAVSHSVTRYRKARAVIGTHFRD